MDKELLEDCFDVIKQNNESIASTQMKVYDDIYNEMQNITQENFSDLNNGYLSVFPCGDYLTNTLCENSLVEFFVIYQTDKENVNFAVVNERITRKGKKRVSTYSKIMSSATNPNVLQAEDVAERIAFQLKNRLKNMQTIFQRRNQIMLKLYNQTIVKITVCYDLGTNHLKVRRVNKWLEIDPIRYLSNVDKKNEQTNGNFSRFVSLFKAMEIELLIANESQLFIGKNFFVENLLYNVPNEFFMLENDNDIINQILIYLKNKNLDSFELIDETGKMFDDYSYYTKNYAKQFIKKIIYANDNFQEILKLSASNLDNQKA